MSATVLSSCSYTPIHSLGEQTPLCPRPFLGDGQRILNQLNTKRVKMISLRFSVFATTEGSAKSSKSEETLPSWARPDAVEPPPWVRDEGQGYTSQRSFEIPFYVYLLASTVTAIAAVGSIFEYVNQRPVFGVVNSDSIFYAPLLGFFAFTGVPSSAFFGSNLFKLLTEKLRSKTGGMDICNQSFCWEVNILLKLKPEKIV